MAKGSFKFKLAKECGIRGDAVVEVGKLVLKNRQGYLGEAKLGKHLVECGKRGYGHLTMADIGLLDMIVHCVEDWRSQLDNLSSNDTVVQDANDLIEVARKFADMDYNEFDVAKKNDKVIHRRRQAMVALVA